MAKKGEGNLIQIPHPAITSKLLSLAGRDRVVCFIISLRSFKFRCIFEFVARLLEREASFRPNHDRIYVVLANSPEIRSEKMKSLGRNANATLMHITPGTPDPDMIENHFSILKKCLSTLRRLKLSTVRWGRKTPSFLEFRRR